MPYTTEEGGRLNNFAKEPRVYVAEPASPNQKRNYIIGGVAGALLVAGLISVAFIVSGVS